MRFVQPWDESEGVVRGGRVKEERTLVLGVWAEVSKEIEERLPCTACKGIQEYMAVGGGSTADAQRAGAPGRSLPSLPSFI